MRKYHTEQLGLLLLDDVVEWLSVNCRSRYLGVLLPLNSEVSVYLLSSLVVLLSIITSPVERYILSIK